MIFCHLWFPERLRAGLSSPGTSARIVGNCHHLKGLHPSRAGSSGVRPVAWFRFFSAAESVAAMLRLDSGCKVVDLAVPATATQILPGGGMSAIASTCGFAAAMRTGAIQSKDRVCTPAACPCKDC